MNDQLIDQAKRDERVNVSLSSRELAIVHRKAAELGFNRPETIRYMIREYEKLVDNGILLLKIIEIEKRVNQFEGAPK